MKQEHFKKVVKWSDGRGYVNFLIFFGFIFLASVLMDYSFWKEMAIIILLATAGMFADGWELPKRKVYWVKIQKDK